LLKTPAEIAVSVLAQIIEIKNTASTKTTAAARGQLV
jgi:xanthine/CO dehydrogenase XdhC/CoxF family maturation factor